MDQATMVMREQIDGGERLINQLRDRGVALLAGAWAKTADDGQWYLYLVAPAVDEKDPRPTYLQVREALAGMGGKWGHPLERVDPFRVKLIGPSEPLARGILQETQRSPWPIPTWHGGSILGSVYVEGAYIYPPSLFQPQPQAG